MLRREPCVRSIKRERIRYFHKNIFQIFLEEMLERKKEKEEIQTSLFDSWSFVGQKSLS